MTIDEVKRFQRTIAASQLLYDPSFKHRKPSGLNQHFYSPSSQFADYISSTQSMLYQARIEPDDNKRLQASQWNAPFELRPKGKPRLGVLCLHGAHDSPYTFIDIATQLQQQGILVRGMLNPGAGSVPADAAFPHQKDFIKMLDYGISSLKQEVDKIVLCGFSFGGLLSVYAAIEHMPVAGLILIAPFLGSTNPFTSFLPLLCQLAKLHPKLAFDGHLPYVHPTRYLTNHWHAALMACRFLKYVQQRPMVRQPLLLIAAAADEVARFADITAFFAQQANPLNRAVFYHRDYENIEENQISYRSSSVNKLDIIEACHLNLPSAPHNPVYGISNAYPLFAHYNYAPTRDDLKKQMKLGDINTETLKKYFIQRLTFNHDFDYMMSKINDFIDTI